jgi:hypothetical protein
MDMTVQTSRNRETVEERETREGIGETLEERETREGSGGRRTNTCTARR